MNHKELKQVADTSHHHKKSMRLLFVALIAIMTFLLFEYIMLQKQDAGSFEKATSPSPTEAPIAYKISGKIVQITPDHRTLFLKPANNPSDSKKPKTNITNQLIPLIPDITEIVYAPGKNGEKKSPVHVKLSTLSNTQIADLIGQEVSLFTNTDTKKSPAPFASTITLLQ